MNSIYVQYPNQSAPSTLYGLTSWVDISSNYNGAFFRANGGNSAAFGTEQGDATAVNGLTSSFNGTSIHGTFGTVNSGGSFTGPFTAGEFAHNYGYGSGNGYYQVNFDYTPSGSVSLNGDTETRPKNYSIKIWKRTA